MHTNPNDPPKKVNPKANRIQNKKKKSPKGKQKKERKTYLNPLLNLPANSTVTKTAGPSTHTSTSSARTWLLVLSRPPISVFQSVTSHWRPRVVILAGPERGMMPMFSSRRWFSVSVSFSFSSSGGQRRGRLVRGVAILLWPGWRMKVMLSSEMR